MHPRSRGPPRGMRGSRGGPGGMRGPPPSRGRLGWHLNGRKCLFLFNIYCLL